MSVENSNQSAVGKSYSISYKINNNNGNSTRIIITFKEVKTPDGKFGVSDIVSSTEDTSSFTCLCPPGKPLYLSNFRAVLAKSTLIKEIRLDNAQSVTVKTRDKRTEKEKEVAGFSSEKGNVDDDTDLLSENEESNGKNFFEVLGDEDNEVYLDITLPPPQVTTTSPQKVSPYEKSETTTASPSKQNQQQKELNEMKISPQKMIEMLKQMDEKEKDELRWQLFPEVLLKQNQQREMEILLLQQKKQNLRRLEVIIEQEEGTVSLQQKIFNVIHKIYPNWKFELSQIITTPSEGKNNNNYIYYNL